MTNIFNIISDTEIEVALVRRIKVGGTYNISTSSDLSSLPTGVVTVTGIYNPGDPKVESMKDVEAYVYMEGLTAGCIEGDDAYKERVRYYNSCMWVEFNFGIVEDYNIRLMDLELFAEHISRY
jgi:hypothetical protein